jgi:FG-GAP repeat
MRQRSSGRRVRGLRIWTLFGLGMALLGLVAGAVMSASARVAAAVPAASPAASTSWSQQAELTASDAGSNDSLGAAVGLSGTTMVAGAYNHTVGSKAHQGAAYVYSNSTGPWKQVAELTAGDGAAGDMFGFSVAISGTTIVVGAPDHKVGSSTDQGAAYVFSNTSGSWKQTAELLAGDGGANAFVGTSVAVSGSTVAVGAISGGGTSQQGAVYVFTGTSGSWPQTAELTASDGVGGDQFGYGLAISGGTIVAGARDHEVGTSFEQGAAYVFTNSLGSWAQTGELTAGDGAAYDQFGVDVAVSGATIVVGDPNHGGQGSVYVFGDASGGWKQTAELTASDGTNNEGFGPVAVSGTTIVVGAPGHQVGQYPFQGAVYVFTGATGAWTQTAEPTPTDAPNGGELGGSVAFDGSTIVAGAPTHRIGTGVLDVGQGAVDVFGSGFKVSGTVFGQKCTDDACNRAGVGGVMVLVKGKASDGTAVKVTATTKPDGTWSVTVPAGSYLAGPTVDGSTFGPPGFDPDQQPVVVSTKDMPKVDMVGCQENSDDASPARLTRASSGADSLAATATATKPSSEVGLCTSVYTLKIGATLPNSPGVPKDKATGGSYLVDPSRLARYNKHHDPEANGYRGSNSALNAFTHVPFIRQVLGNGRQYPQCLGDAKTEEFTNEGFTGKDVKWYSYLTGHDLGAYNVQLAYDQSNGHVTLASDPAAKYKGPKLTRVWEWKDEDGETGHCQQASHAQLTVLPVPDGKTFTIVLAWGFPFEAPGARAENSEIIRNLIERNVKYWGREIGVDSLVKAYEGSPEGVKFAFEMAVSLALATGGLKLASLAPAALRALAAEWTLTDEQAAWALKLADYAHVGHTLGEYFHVAHATTELTSFIDSFGGTYPVMSAVVRGSFNTVPLDAGFSGDTTLSVSTKTTKFPNISMVISRAVYPTTVNGEKVFSGRLPWANRRYNTPSVPAVSNSFPHAQFPLINDTAGNGQYYASGTDALTAIWAETRQLPDVETAIEDGNLGVKFDQERAEDHAPPSCAETAPGIGLSPGAAPPGAICWIFGDGRA